MFTTYDLLDDVADLRNWFDGFFNERPYLGRRADYPYVNLYENNDDIHVAVIAPGVKAEDINLQLINNRLTIDTEKKSDYLDKPYIRKERNFGAFKKVVELPYRVDPNKIEASMKDGILTVKLTRAEETKPKKIEIH
ncbi:MAG: Hsp20/alpha crystallin family protein [Spirochaetes bacterium]|nr:Hsp20/alpha crystallin family protein [Spirochaetota bacterium]